MQPQSPVIRGLEQRETVIGKDQPEYMPLPALRSPDGRVMSRWQLTPDERAMIANGGDIFVTIWTFNRGPYPPTQVEVGNVNGSPDHYAKRLGLDPPPEPPTE